MSKYEGDWALVTGASSGIGYEIARLLAASGHKLILVSRNEERLCQVARELNGISDIIIMPVDLSLAGSAKTLYDECERLGLKIIILVNNAGFGKFGESPGLNHCDVEAMLTLNVTSLTLLSNLFGKRMKERKSGYILNVASTAAYLPIPYFSAYSSSKAYVKHFTRALRQELKIYDVKVTCLLPGATDTRFFDIAFPNKSEVLKWQHVMSARKVAATGLKGLFNGRKEVVPGILNKFISLTAGLVPLSILSVLIRRNFSLPDM